MALSLDPAKKVIRWITFLSIKSNLGPPLIFDVEIHATC
jgi:hypothetical protein